MLKRFFFLAIILLTSSCSNMGNFGLGSLFGPPKPKKDRNYYNSDAYYLEDENDAAQAPTYREEQVRLRRNSAPRMYQRERYYAEERNYTPRVYQRERHYVEEDDYEDDDENYYNYRTQKDGCAFCGSTPTSRNAKKQLYQQKRDYYRR